MPSDLLKAPTGEALLPSPAQARTVTEIAEHATATHLDLATEHLHHAADLAIEDDETITTVLHLCQWPHRPALAREVYHRHAAAMRASRDIANPEVEQLARRAMR